MTKTSRKTIRYSDCFKLSIVKEIEENGLSISQCQTKYGVKGGRTIQNWLKEYGKNHLLNKIIQVETMDERDELKRLKEENKALRLAYAELSLEHKCSEKVIEVADQMFSLDLKKKYAQELSAYSKKKKK